MRLVVEEHSVVDFSGSFDLADHMHQVHHVPRRDLPADIEAIELQHADDHDDLRRGCG